VGGMQCNVEFGYRLSICSRTGKSHGNLDRVGQSQDLLNVYLTSIEGDEPQPTNQKA
jgi:hypothetical protein